MRSRGSPHHVPALIAHAPLLLFLLGCVCASSAAGTNHPVFSLADPLSDLFCTSETSYVFPWRRLRTQVTGNATACKYVARKGEVLGAYRAVPSTTHPIPIYVLFKDKTTDLRELLRSTHEVLNTPFQVVVIDFHSTIQSALDLLAWLEAHGVTVWRTRLAGSQDPDMLNHAGDIIRHDLDARATDVNKYVVTDADISLAGATGDVLTVYSALLDAFPDVNVVGPSLRLDDLPAIDATYLERREQHIEMFFPPALPSWTRSDGRQRIYYSRAPIDTTFGMFRRSYRFRRMTQGLRVHFPYAMRHVDFYYHLGEAMPPEMHVYGCRANAITHFHVDNCTGVLQDSEA